ncbi:MAG: dynamin family protein [Akkermansia sp.]|nr:dynamin family protein [Akkermansia sp.]
MEQVTKSILAAAQFNNKLTGEPISEDFTKQIKRFGAGIFRLVVMGEIKKGKSSFINAFLGVKDLVPVASDVATSTVFKIHYGQEAGYRVFFEKSTGKAPVRIEAAELADYGTENGNPGNRKQVDFIEVISTAPLLKTGLVIIDTPGLGGLFKEHKKITWNYVPKADAVFFVTDSVESPIGLEELEHLNTVRKITQHLYFVQTKASAVDAEACEARRQNNLSILSRAFNTPADKIPYFVVDSLRKFSADEDENFKRLERSGYPALMTYINNNLLSQQHRILAGKAISLATPILTSISSNISARKETLSADTAEEQQRARAAISKAEQELLNWQTEKLPELSRSINREFADLKAECERDCAMLRPNGELHASLEDAINSCENKEQLAGVVETLYEKMPEAASARMTEIRNKLETGVADIMKSLWNETNTQLALRIGAHSQNGSTDLTLSANNHYAPVIQVLTDGGDLYKGLRNGAIGGSIGMSIGSFVGGAVGSIIPGLGTAIGASIGGLIGSFWGGYEAGKELEEQELRQAKQLALNGLSKNISSIYSDITNALRDLFRRFSDSVDDAMRQSLRQRTAELKKVKDDLVERSRMSAAELSKAKNELAKDEATLRTIMKTLEPWMPANH